MGPQRNNPFRIKTVWKIKPNYFLSICRLLYCRAPAHGSATQVSRGHSLLQPKCICSAGTRYLKHVPEPHRWGKILLHSQTATMGCSSPNSLKQDDFRKSSWWVFLKPCFCLAQSFALIKEVELFIHTRKSHIVYWMQVILVDMVIFLMSVSEHVNLGELKTGAHISGRFPYLRRKRYKTSEFWPEVFRTHNQLKDKYANTLHNTIFSWSKCGNSFF